MIDYAHRHPREVAYVAARIVVAVERDKALTESGQMTMAAVIIIAGMEAAADYRSMYGAPLREWVSDAGLDEWAKVNEMPAREPDEVNKAYRGRLYKLERQVRSR